MKFRKKPVVIDAVQFKGGMQSADKTIAWSIYQGAGGGELRYDRGLNAIEIRTLEGTMAASPDDWVIRGVKGEFYPCRADIFEATYDAVEGDGS